MCYVVCVLFFSRWCPFHSGHTEDYLCLIRELGQVIATFFVLPHRRCCAFGDFLIRHSLFVFAKYTYFIITVYFLTTKQRSSYDMLLQCAEVNCKIRNNYYLKFAVDLSSVAEQKCYRMKPTLHYTRVMALHNIHFNSPSYKQMCVLYINDSDGDMRSRTTFS